MGNLVLDIMIRLYYNIIINMKYQILDTISSQGTYRVHTYGCRDIQSDITKLRAKGGWTITTEDLKKALIKESEWMPEVMDGIETPESFAEKSWFLAPCTKGGK
jgi:hypothetical protein